MAHDTPRILQISTIVCLSVFPDNKAWGSARDGQVDDRRGVGHGFDGVRSAVCRELHSYVVGVEVAFVVGEIHVGKLVGAPEVWGGLVWVEDLSVELGGCVDTTATDVSPDSIYSLRWVITYTTLE